MIETIANREYLRRENQEGKTTAKKIIDETPKYPWYLKLIRFAFSTFGPLFPKAAAKQAIKLFSTPRRRAKHKVSDRIMEEARVFEFMFKGKILKGYEWGSGTKNILLVHGWESRGTALRSFVPTLLAKGYKVVTFDAPAHGNSGGKQTNLLEFAGAIKAIINQIGGVEGIIAHSFGGASTVYALSQLQQTRRLKRLVLIASPSRMIGAMEDFLKLIRAPKTMEDEFYKIVKSLLEIPIEDIDIAKLYDEVDVEKTMLIHDKGDRIVPFSSSERVAAGWKDIRFVVTEGYGHFEMVKDPKVVEMVGGFVGT
ncbi:MAG: alpha/beta fold hydrolase [Saprospiraceae bacterium]